MSSEVNLELPSSSAGQVFGGRGHSDFAAFGPDGPDATPLFRPEALRHASETGFGRPVARLPVSWSILTIVMLAGAAVAGIVMARSSYTRAETVRGIVQPSSGEVQVGASARATVQALFVKDGDIVRAGQLLVTALTPQTELSGQDSQTELLASLQQQEQSVVRRLDAIGSEGSLDDHAADAQLQSLQTAVATAREDLKSAEERRDMAQQQYTIAEPLAGRGFVSGMELAQRKQALIVARQAVADATGQINGLLAQIQQQRSIAAKRPFDSVKERGLLEDTLADIRQRRATYAMGKGFAIRAPVAGRVTSIQASVGSISGPEHPLLSIVPAGSKMSAILYVPSRGIGFLRPKQRVRIRFDAFPFEAAGASMGTVETVSHTVLRPEEVEAAVKLDESSYKVVVRLDQQSVIAFERARPILPGMAFTADVILERRSFLHWLLQPLYSATGRK